MSALTTQSAQYGDSDNTLLLKIAAMVQGGGAPLIPTTLVFSTQPAGAVVDVAFTTQPVVTVKDQFGATLTTYTGQVTVAMDIGDPGSVGGTTTIAFVAGVATFTNLSIDEAQDSAHIAATIPELFPTTFLSNAFEVAAQTIAFFVQPGGAVEGEPFTQQPVVRKLNGASVDTSFTGIVTMTKLSGSGTLSGDTTIACVAGVATFVDLEIDDADDYVLRASIASPVRTVDSSSFEVEVDTSGKVAGSDRVIFDDGSGELGVTSGPSWLSESGILSMGRMLQITSAGVGFSPTTDGALLPGYFGGGGGLYWAPRPTSGVASGADAYTCNFNRVLIWDGNSNTAAGAFQATRTAYRNLAWDDVRFNHDKWFSRSFGVNGQTISQMITHALADYVQANSVPLSDFADGRLVIIAAQETLNQMEQSETDALEMQDFFIDYCAACHAIAPSVKIIYQTQVGGSASPAVQLEMDAFQTWLLANWEDHADGLVDLTGVTGIDDYENPTYYTDRYHPNEVIHAAMAPLWADEIARVAGL